MDVRLQLKENISDLSKTYKMFNCKKATATGFNATFQPGVTSKNNVFISNLNTTGYTVVCTFFEPLEIYEILYFHLIYFAK